MESKDILLEDLVYLEQDLERYELVSVLFVLYGDSKADWIVNKLSDPCSKNFLQDYAEHHNNWKTSIVQALTVARIFEIVNNLGIAITQAEDSLTTNPAIHPGLRLLYELCEACKLEVTGKFIAYIKTQCPAASKLREDYLELYLLCLIASSHIKIGPTLNECDFTFISNYFASNHASEVDEVLKKFPSKQNFADATSAAQNGFQTMNLTPEPVSHIGRYLARKLQVLIINQAEFYRDPDSKLQPYLPGYDLRTRHGTARDAEALETLFKGFGYPVTVELNLTHTEIMKSIDRFTKKGSVCDGLIVCIMSHGHKGIVYGSNSIGVEIKNIRDTMASARLLSKPKMLFIQACQGDGLQKVVKKLIPQLEYDGPNVSVLREGSVHAEFLIFWSTIEGFASIRHIENGSWFIQELVKKIRELHRTQHLMDICTAVTRDISNMRGNRDECMLSKLETTFTLNFYFPALKSESNC